jgi:hypothetical protein
MPNVRVTPTAKSPNPFTIPGTGRKYTCAVGSTIDVPDFDAAVLKNAGWLSTTAGDGSVGTTAQRPANAHAQQEYLDTTVGAIVISDGKGNWLHHVTGVAS